MTAPTFRTGVEAAQEASKTTSGYTRPINYLSLADDESAIIRILTERKDWITVAQHTAVPTKNPPSDYDGTWPSHMTAVCRKDVAFAGIHKDCWICDAGITTKWGKPIGNGARIWAIGVLREEVIGTQEMADAGQIEQHLVGRRAGCSDAMHEINEIGPDGKPTGRKVMERQFLILNFAWSNFYKHLAGFGDAYGTVCDRDYFVKRVGAGKDTDYVFAPLDPTPNLQPGTERWNEKYIVPMQRLEISLGEIITYRASDEYYARWFDPTKAVVDGKVVDVDAAVAAAAAAPAASTQTTQVDEDKLAALRDRVRSTASVKADID